MPASTRTVAASRFARVFTRPLRPLRIGILGLGVLMVACAGKDQGAYDAFAAKRLFAVGYQDISEIYIEDVALRDLALAGLERIESVDPKVVIERRSDGLTVRAPGADPRTFALPDGGDADAWGTLTANVVNAGRTGATTLNGASAERIYEAVFEGMMTRLDRYSRYAGADEAQKNRANRDGFGGIGVRIRRHPDGIEVLSVMDDSPAAAAGLRAGDVILQVAGTPVGPLNEDNVTARLRGRVGTSVELIVRRAKNAPPRQMAVTRAHIVPQTVSYRREGNAAVIRVSGFNQDTAAALRRTIKRARRDVGQALKGFVLDLRGNPGGLLDQAVEVSDLFITSGQIVSTHGRHPDSHQYFDAAPDDVADGLPVVVLMNAGSASASEIVAAAIQDTGRGVVVGSASYGKGTVQTVLRLPNQGELTLTWARFHAPSGYALSKRGVIPDVCTSRSQQDAAAILTELEHGNLPTRRRPDRGMLRTGTDGDIAALRAQCPARQVEGPVDTTIALRLLREHELYRVALGGRPSRLAQASR